MVGAELQRDVDILHRADAFMQRVDRFVDHRQQDAVDDKGREILGDDRRLAEPVGQALDDLVGRVVGGDAGDQFDQLHDRHRVHEMHAYEFFRAVRGRAQPGDRNRRRVGRDDRIRPQRRQDRLVDFAFDGLVLGRGLDHDIAVAERRVIGRARQAVERVLLVGGADLVALHLAFQVPVDIGDGFVELVLGDIVHHDIDAGDGGDMGDAGSHLPGADDADFLDAHRFGRCTRILDISHAVLSYCCCTGSGALARRQTETSDSLSQCYCGPVFRAFSQRGLIPCFSSSSSSSGTILNRSPTRP